MLVFNVGIYLFGFRIRRGRGRLGLEDGVLNYVIVVCILISKGVLSGLGNGFCFFFNFVVEGRHFFIFYWLILGVRLCFGGWDSKGNKVRRCFFLGYFEFCE